MVDSFPFIENVEQMLEYLRVWRMPAAQRVSTMNLKYVETFVDILTYAKRFHSMFWKRNVFRNMLGLRYFTMLCNNAEYKNGPRQQSWSVVRCTDWNTDLLQVTRLDLLIYYDKNFILFSISNFQIFEIHNNRTIAHWEGTNETNKVRSLEYFLNTLKNTSGHFYSENMQNKLLSSY